MIIKAGYKTSEFWFTLVSFIFSGLYLTGIITDNSQKDELISTVSHAVESVILIGGQAIILYRYIKGRNEVKKIVETEKLIQVTTERKNDDSTKRSNKRTTRKSNSKNKRVSNKSKKSSN